MRRLAVAAVAALALGVLDPGVTSSASPPGHEQGPRPVLAPATDDHAGHGGHDVAAQNQVDHDAHRSEVVDLARANGLAVADGADGCGDWFRFETKGGVRCSKGPMLEEMFTADQLAAASEPPVYGADPKVTCIGTGSDGKRLQLVYVRRSNKADRYAATALQMKGWAAAVEQTLVQSAQKTGGMRKARWAHDANCVPTVLNLTVGTTVTQFSQLVSALESAGLTSSARKYLVAWDDGDGTGAFCGLGESIPDSTAGSSNRNETQPAGAMFAAVEPQCWTSSVAAHEIMHTLGAVQADAPHATDYGHCTDESDLMCYVDGPGSVMTQVCAAAEESLLDCRNDDYFHTNPPTGNYLKTHWNPASSGFLDASGSVGPPFSPEDPSIAAGSGSVTASWQPPAFDGGTPILGYVATASPGGRSVTVGAAARSAVISGLADGTAVTVTISAVNAQGQGSGATTGSATPSPPVLTRATAPTDDRYADLAEAPDGSLYLARQDRIDKLAPNGTLTTVVGGGEYEFPVPENTLPLATSASPSALAVAANGDLYFYDEYSAKVRRVSGGRVNSVAGNGEWGNSGDGGSALAAAIAVDALAVSPADGSVLLLDGSAQVVRRFAVGGTIAKVAGTADQSGATGDGGPATAARFSQPSDLAVDSSGKVFVADTSNHRIRAFTVGGTISTVAGNGSDLLYPGAVLPATGTGVGYPSAIDWSAEKGLLIDTYGAVRALSGANLVRVAGDPFDGETDVDGTAAAAIAYTLQDQIGALAWAGSALHVLATGPGPSGFRSRVRSAGPWSTGGSTAAPAAPVVAPVAKAGPLSATVSWVPASNNGSAITSYRVTTSPGGAVTTAGPDATQATITGLTAGTSYTFTVAAVNGVGTGAASAASNAVVPTSGTPWAPFSSWALFVSRQYQDVIGRPPNGTESAAGVAALNGGKTKGQFVEDLRRGSENTTNVDPTARLYRAFLGRAPDAGGLRFWIGRRRAGTWSLTRMADSFAASNEFKTKYGTLTNRQFVTRIYTDVLGRTADAAGVDYWTRKLDTRAKTRGGVMVGFSESSEYKRKQLENTDVAVAHIFLLGRAATPAETADWTTRQKAGTAHAVLLQELLSSPGYAARFTS